MRVPFYDIKAQYVELASDLDQVVHDVLASGEYVTGVQCQAIEAEVAALHGVQHAIALNSGTDALRIIMDAVGVGRGDEVITTAFTFVASAETIVQTGARPVFVDILPETFDLDPDLIEAAITPRTKAIMPIHLFGQMAVAERIQEIADRHGLLVIEDAAQAIGSHRHGIYAGNFGIAAGLSFYVTKNLGAAGDAGMILTNDEAVAVACRSIRIHGMGRQRYHYDHLGYTSRMDEIQAAVLRVKLTKLAEWAERKDVIAAIYTEGLANTDLTLPIVRAGNNHMWHQYSLLSDRRDELILKLKAAGTDAMIYYPVPLHFHEPYCEFGNGPGSLPITEHICEQVFSLPIHPHLTLSQAEHVVTALRT